MKILPVTGVKTDDRERCFNRLFFCLLTCTLENVVGSLTVYRKGFLQKIGCPFITKGIQFLYGHILAV